MRHRASPFSIAAGLAIATSLLAAGCPLRKVAIAQPQDGSLHDDPGVSVSVRVGRNFVHTGASVRVDGVDLIAALGLTPPFTDASGSVSIGTDLVAVTDFDYEIPAPPGPIRVSATLTGLAVGDHIFESEAPPIEAGALGFDSHTFAVVEPFVLAVETFPSAGTPPPGLVTLGGRPRAVTLGDSLAAPAVGIAGGGTLRPGFVPAAQARSGGIP
jgi:hypothetical protein